MYPQQIVILVSVISVVGFLAYGSAAGRLRRLTVPVLLLVGVAMYEAYMSYVWEKKVSAAIRLDLLFEIAVIAVALIYGLLVSLRERRPRS